MNFSRKTLLFYKSLNSQAPDVPELAHQGIFQFSQLSVNCYVETVKKYSLYLNRTDFMRVLSVPQDHCGTHNNFMKIFSKNYTLYGVYIFSNFGVPIVLHLTTQKHIFIYQKLFWDYKGLPFRFQWYEFIVRSNKIRSPLFK